MTRKRRENIVVFALRHNHCKVLCGCRERFFEKLCRRFDFPFSAVYFPASSGLIPLFRRWRHRRYRENRIIINRRYQRKLVWSEEENARLIDSILKGYPIPLILFAEITGSNGIIYYEVLDGMQRLNAIVGFLENLSKVFFGFLVTENMIKIWKIKFLKQYAQ
ncbi:MAG: DUF262 domain-containing protein [Oscillospiraceae bacterium]|nr:DUF262 domain-containing protein [Oscillospiraceae bacterium]